MVMVMVSCLIGRRDILLRTTIAKKKKKSNTRNLRELASCISYRTQAKYPISHIPCQMSDVRCQMPDMRIVLGTSLLRERIYIGRINRAKFEFEFEFEDRD